MEAHAGQRRPSAEEYVSHTVEVATIVDGRTPEAPRHAQVQHVPFPACHGVRAGGGQEGSGEAVDAVPTSHGSWPTRRGSLTESAGRGRDAMVAQSHGESRMNTTLDELHSAVLSLPEAERARLAAYRRGEVGAVAAEEVLEKARGIVGSGASATFCSGRQHRE